MEMKEIKCPNCGKVFSVDESGYAAILNQVKNEEFDKEIKEREEAIKAKVLSDSLIQKQKLYTLFRNGKNRENKVVLSRSVIVFRKLLQCFMSERLQESIQFAGTT